MAGSSWNLLAAALGFLLLLILTSRLSARLCSRRLRQLAARERMRYSAIDRFHLAPRVAEWLGTGAADVRVRDLMYRIGDGDYLYLFTAEYAIGTIRGARRRRVVARTSEPTGRSTPRLTAVTLADAGRPLREQYLELLHDTTQKSASEINSPADSLQS